MMAETLKGLCADWEACVRFLERLC